jgi:hypothetical protein
VITSVEIDHYGERLTSCSKCNRWRAETGEWCRLAPDDIVALRAVQAHKNQTGDSETDKQNKIRFVKPHSGAEINGLGSEHAAKIVGLADGPPSLAGLGFDHQGAFVNGEAVARLVPARIERLELVLENERMGRSCRRSRRCHSCKISAVTWTS